MANSRQLIMQDKEHVVGALLKVVDEQIYMKPDRSILIKLAKTFRRAGNLDPIKIQFVKAKMMKYCLKLDKIGFQPVDSFGPPANPKTTADASAELYRGRVLVRIPKNKKIISKIKKVKGTRYVQGDNSWSMPLCIETISLLDDFGIGYCERIEEWVQQNTGTTKKSIKVPGLGGTLRKFQEICVAFADDRKGRILLGDEQGLGKTIETLAYIQLRYKEMSPALITCPHSVKINWAREAEKWLNDPTIYVLSGLPSKDIAYEEDLVEELDNYLYRKGTGATVIIANYDILADKQYKGDTLWGWGRLFQRVMRPAFIAVDEVQSIKNTKTARYQIIKIIAKKAKGVFGISGTPIENCACEFYPIINLINSSLYPSFGSFANRFCNPKWNGFAWDYSGSSNAAQLYKELSMTIMIRRKKSEVAKELPKKQRIVVPMEIDNKDQIWKVKRDQSLIGMARDTKLRQLAALGKIKGVIEWIETYLESGKKFVVFAHHKAVIEKLTDHFKERAVKIDGSISSATKRQSIVDQFASDDKIRLFIGNMKAAGKGTDGLQFAAEDMGFVEFLFTSTGTDQAEDRIHRIGQSQSDTSNFYYFVAVDTIEEDDIKRLDDKRDVMTMIYDGKRIDRSSKLHIKMQRRK